MTLKLMGSSSGSTSIEAPASGSDRTITFPDATGTVDTTGRAGNILQVQQTSITSRESMYVTASYTDCPGLFSIQITPQASTSKIIVMAMINQKNYNQHYGMRFVRRVGGADAVPSGTIGDASSSRTQSLTGNIYNVGFNGVDSNMSIPINFVDHNHGTTSTITYQLQAHNSNNAYYMYFNSSHADTDASYSYRGISTIIAMEIAV